LFNETKEALERQTATSEILGVISSSPTDLRPVFDTILDRATRLCGAEHAILYHCDGETFETVACRGLTAEEEARFRSAPIQPGPHSGLGRMLAESRAVQVGDLTDDAAYREGDPRRMRFVTVLGARSAMWGPLLKNGVVVGAVAIYRREMRPFLEAQVDLVATFADQAVIAIENVRLFKELQSSNRELTEALEQQTATSEILRVISRSQIAVQPVFDTIVASAVRLCPAHIGSVFQFDGAMLHFVPHHNFPSDMLDSIRALHPKPPQRDMVSGRAILSRAVVQIEDVLADREYHRAAAAATSGRSMVAVPMPREGEPIGAIVINRVEPGAFADSHLELLKTFADQAVIAIENVRLFTELQARTHELTRSVGQLTALGEVGRAVSSTLDLQTVLTTIV